MDTAEILAALGNPRSLPIEALRAARERKSELVPHFAAALAAAAEDRFDLAAKPDLPFFAFHLLGEWEETGSFASIIRLLRSSRAEKCLGDATTLTVHRVIVRVYGGDPAPLFALVLDRSADEFIRSRACEAVAMLTVAERIPRADVSAFLAECFTRFQEEPEPRFVWNGWENAIANLALDELVPLVQEAFARKLIDPSWMSYSHFEEDFAAARSGTAFADFEYAPLDDAVAEFSAWGGFGEDGAEWSEGEAASIVDDDERPWQPSDPVHNPLRHVGRNDPCPCGSGKKFKKCCLVQGA